MRQSRLMTLFEVVGGTALGFVVSLVIQYAVCRYFGLPLSASDNVGIIGIFTVASLLRGYVWRRLCEALHIRRHLSPMMNAVIHERFRQVDAEGFSFNHDDDHDKGELGRAGACYIIHAGTVSPTVPHDFPWESHWWKPNGYRRDLVRGIALAIAEGERFDRSRVRRERRAQR